MTFCNYFFTPRYTINRVDFKAFISGGKYFERARHKLSEGLLRRKGGCFRVAAFSQLIRSSHKLKLD